MTAFSVDQRRDLWYCFSRSGGGGDAIRLAYLLCGSSWPRTAAWLHRIARTVSTDPRAIPATANTTSGTVRSFRAFPHALALDATHPFFARMGLEPATVRRFEAGAWHGRGFLERTVAVRLYDPQGRPLGYAGRRLDPGEVRRFGKWTFPARFPKGDTLYGFHRVERELARGLIVVESPWSVMKLWQAGLCGAVALCGVSVSAAQRDLLASATRILLMLDGDDTGKTASRGLAGRRVHPNLVAADLPDGTDPADLDEEHLRALVRAAWLD